MNPHFEGSTHGGDEQFPPDPSRGEVLVRVGNDIVDLEHRRCRGRGPDDPLFERILAETERSWLRATGADELSPVRAWALWASKEAAFKVLCKLSGGAPTLRHRSYVCQLHVQRPRGSPVVSVEGTVQGPDDPQRVWVEGSSDLRYLHVVAANGTKAESGTFELGLEGTGSEDTSGELAGLEDRFTPEEWAGVHSRPSARVRLLARERMKSHLRTSERVEILTSATRPGRTPPRLRVGGRDRPDLDVSLSHHGQYVAWAILIPTAADGCQKPDRAGAP